MWIPGTIVRVWKSLELPEVSGTGMEVLQNSEVPGILARSYRTHRSSGRVQKMWRPYPGYCGTGRTELAEVSGTGMKVLQNFHKFRVLWHGRTKLTEVPRVVARAYRAHISSGRVQEMLYPYPGYCGTGRTELTKFPSTGMNLSLIHI